MSKQSNAFQKAIHYIHKQLEGTDAVVTESAELKEENTPGKILREIDVLIEKEIQGKIFRIAIECRDRSSKDDIEWIDSLIGKYKNIQVHKIIAVSNSGFSENATIKASANQIEIRSTEQLMDVDWKKEYTALGFCSVSMNFEIMGLIVTIQKGTKIKVLPQTHIYRENSKITVEGFVKILVEKGWRQVILERFNKRFSEIYKTRADINIPASIEHTIPVSNFQIEFETKLHEITSFTVFLLATPHVEEIQPNVRKYEDSLITQAVFENEDINKKFVLFATQAQAGDKQIHISFNKKNSK